MSIIADAIAQSGGVPQAFHKDDQPGKTVTGTIVDATMRQTTSFDTGEPETWQDGSPKQQIILTLQTNERDPENRDDDGQRRIYIKWWGDQKKNLVSAVRQAGDTDVRPGGTFTATFTGFGESTNPRFNPPKLYAYQYQKPALGIATEVAQQPAPVQQPTFQPTEQATNPWATAPAPAAAAPVQQAAPQTAPALDPAKTEQAMNLIRAGLDDQVIANALQLDADGIAALAALRAAA